jgi:hypothetical protein
VLPQGVSVRAQLLEGDRLRRHSPRATVAAVVIVDEVHHFAQGIKPGVQAGVIEAQAAVHHQAGQPLADFNVEQLSAAEVCHRHRSSSSTRFPDGSLDA